jgi:hypothetical protein
MLSLSGVSFAATPTQGHQPVSDAWSFTDEQRTDGTPLGTRRAREDLSLALDQFAPGRLHGHRRMLSKLPTEASKQPLPREREESL